MSERNTGHTSFPETPASLEMSVGELRAELRHLMGDTARRFEELRAEQDDRIAALEAAVADIPAMLDRVLEIAEEMKAHVSRNGDSKTKATEATTTTPPARNQGERSDAWSKRLAAWAKEQGVTAPPKPRPLDNADTYEARIQKWIQEIAE